ncbi:hypothetical protein D3C87_1833190 [compost metagenome]
MEQRFPARLALRPVILGELGHRAREQHDGDQVHRRHQSHRGVGRVEHGGHAFIGAPDHHGEHAQPQHRQPGAIADPEEGHGILGIGIIADD